MRFTETKIAGAYLIEPMRRSDDRGYFARVFCEEEMSRRGLVSRFVQTNHSHNFRRGTLRGLHWQKAPHGEVKLLRAVRGAVFDVMVDMRPDSPSYGRWAGFELDEDNGRMVYIPAGCAHGYQALTDGAAVSYQVSCPYTPEAEAGLRWDDPSIGIAWPLTPHALSDKDQRWPDVHITPEPESLR